MSNFFAGHRLEKVAIEGEEKNELMVMGEGICAAKLVTILRKKVGFAEVVSVGPVEKKKEEKPIVPFVYGNYQMPPLQFWEVRDPYYYPFWWFVLNGAQEYSVEICAITIKIVKDPVLVYSVVCDGIDSSVWINI